MPRVYYINGGMSIKVFTFANIQVGIFAFKELKKKIIISCVSEKIKIKVEILQKMYYVELLCTKW